MADFQLADNQNVTVGVSLADKANNPVTGDVLDAGSVAAVVSDTTVATAVVSADQTSVLVTALGPEVIAATVTVSGTFGGVAMTDGVLTFDVVASAPTQITLTPGAPVANA